MNEVGEIEQFRIQPQSSGIESRDHEDVLDEFAEVHGLGRDDVEEFGDLRLAEVAPWWFRASRRNRRSRSTECGVRG
jgi:hypothetical protein